MLKLISFEPGWKCLRKLLGTDTAINGGNAPGCWRYVLEQDFVWESPHLAGVTWSNEWVVIQDGRIRVREGYAWDGCTPAWSVLGLVYIGTPDGAEYLGKPAAYYASLVHDVLCQWRLLIPITKAAVLGLFYEMLKARQFRLAGLYVAVVARLGPQEFAGDMPG
ncbi:MAG: hypothetical protein JNM11_12690 [Chitinimonas sp.]|nr:hypothetical protein [Chitinimonas sp.]